VTSSWVASVNTGVLEGLQVASMPPLDAVGVDYPPHFSKFSDPSSVLLGSSKAFMGNPCGLLPKPHGTSYGVPSFPGSLWAQVGPLPRPPWASSFIINWTFLCHLPRLPWGPSKALSLCSWGPSQASLGPPHAPFLCSPEFLVKPLLLILSSFL
jgi:hypothetical protein